MHASRTSLSVWLIIAGIMRLSCPLRSTVKKTAVPLMMVLSTPPAAIQNIEKAPLAQICHIWCVNVRRPRRRRRRGHGHGASSAQSQEQSRAEVRAIGRAAYVTYVTLVKVRMYVCMYVLVFMYIYIYISVADVPMDS